jgi:hypothetical protein
MIFPITTSMAARIDKKLGWENNSSRLENCIANTKPGIKEVG